MDVGHNAAHDHALWNFPTASDGSMLGKHALSLLQDSTSMGMPHSAPGHSGHRDTGTPGHWDRLSGSLHAKITYISRGREGGEQCVKTVHESCACFPLQYPGTLHEHRGYRGTRVPGCQDFRHRLARLANMHQSKYASDSFGDTVFTPVLLGLHRRAL